MNPKAKLGAFLGTLVVVAGMAFGIAKTISDGDEPNRNGSTTTMSDRDDAGGHGGVYSSDDRFRVVMNEIDFQPNVVQDVQFQIRKGSQVVRDYEVESARELHLVVVRHDLSEFQHVHPKRGEDGTWRAKVTFESSGPHRAYADFQVDGDRQMIPFDLKVTGDYNPRTIPDPQNKTSVDGYDVAMSSAGEGANRRLTFRVSRNDRPIDDLQDYLGSKGHLVAIDTRTLSYSHVHPVGAKANAVAFGSDLQAGGTFRLFFQFLHDGRVHTAPLTIQSDQQPEPGARAVAPEQMNPRESDDQRGGTEHPPVDRGEHQSTP